jgi:hypothetical protein
VLARLWSRVEPEPQATPKPLPLTDARHPWRQPPPPTAASHRCHKPRQKAVRVCRLYPEPPSQAAIHAQALIALIQEECPQHIGGYVPRPDMESCYRELCMREGWKVRHWTAIARQLGELTDKKSVRHRGQRFIGYRIPKCAQRVHS